MYTEYINGAPIIPITKSYYFNYCGSISFSVMKDGKPVSIGYISGIPDSMKSDIVNNPSKIIGKVYEITCMEIECISGEYSLRHAKIIQERLDKKPEDCDWSQISI
jgi:hypothetical protein